MTPRSPSPRRTPAPARRGSRWTLPSCLVAALAAGRALVGCGSDEDPATDEVALDRPASAASPDADEAPPGADPSPTDAFADDPPTAKRRLHQELVASLHLEYGPGDGGGSARLLSATPVRAGELGRWVIEYTAGPQGIEVGGSLHFQVSPFWGWSSPQTFEPARPGYTEVECSAPEVVLEPTPILDSQLLMLEVREAALPPGATVRIDYGAGETGAQADRFAEAEEWFSLYVDGDGDGTRKLIEDRLVVQILPREFARLIVTLPSTRRPGEDFALHLATVDRMGNAVWDAAATFHLEAPAALGLPEVVELVAGDGGGISVPGTAAEGVHVVRVRHEDQSFDSNPMVVTPGIPRLYWADLHGHSTRTDGTATPEDYYRYGREIAALDVCVLTDHDHFGKRALDTDPELWRALCETTERHHDPGRFVTLHGFEWTSWLYGHRHVLEFAEPGPVISSLAETTDDPGELWAALRGREALTVAHHPASDATAATDWSFAPPPDIEPVVEIVSVHGSSEGPGAPRSVRGMVPESSVRAALNRGYQLGFIGSGDSHDGHPGLVHLAGPGGGLAALRADELTRPAIRRALLERRTYATNGARIFLSFRSGTTPMGGRVGVGEDGVPFSIFVVGTAPLESIELIRDGQPLIGWTGDTRPMAGFDWTETEARPGSYYYLRVSQQDGGMAWSSPIWVVAD